MRSLSPLFVLLTVLACGEASPDLGEASQPIVGDGVIDGVETCDDSNTDSGDGCSDLGAIEDRFVCPSVGALCLADTDRDLVADVDDLDDDNDGVPDAVEANNFLVNEGFESFNAPTGGNNIGIDIQPWVPFSQAATNVVKVDGSVSILYGGSGPELDANPTTLAGTEQHYYDVANANGFFHQSFTVCATDTYTYSGFFSSRDDEPGTFPGSLAIHEGVGTGGAILSQVDNGVVGSEDSQFEPWTFVENSVVLSPGTYTFAVDMDNFLNFDEGSLTAAGPHDSDCDGIPDVRDLDSDNDGIFDAVEAGHDGGHTDGRVCDSTGVGVNGLCDVLETVADSGITDYDSNGAGPDAPAQGEGDNVADLLDLDSDNDGIFDVIEADSGCADVAPRDGRCDGPVDGDGVSTSITNPLADADSDLVPDYLDLDSDNDGIPDVVEGASGCADTTPADNVCDGPFSAVGVAVDAVNSPPDSDGDGTLDFRDLDSNDDGIFDIIQGGTGCTDTTPADNRCDGPVDGTGVTPTAGPVNTNDSDTDGVSDLLDSAPNDNTECRDVDGDSCDDCSVVRNPPDENDDGTDTNGRWR